jgi:AcrR family transcriptional regulator
MPRTDRPPIPAPQQERSRASMERILEATEALLLDRPFDEITVREIVREAESSVGAFYNLFGEKDALLPFLIDRHYDEMSKTAASVLTDPRCAAIGLSERGRLLIEHGVTALRRKRGLYREIFLRLVSRPEGMTEHERERNESVKAQMVRWLLERKDDCPCPDADAAIRFAFLQMYSTMNNAILAQPPTDVIDFGDDELVDRMHAAFVACLGLHAPDGDPQ